MSITATRIACVLAACCIFAAAAHAQWLDPHEGESRWELSANGGFLSSGTWLETRVNGEPVSLESDSAWLVGVKAALEQEYLALELSVAGAFAAADLEADPAALVGDAEDISILLADVNVLLYPFGDELADGRIKPFITAGPGLLYFDSDFGPADNELGLDTNAGAGIKVLLGQNDDVVLRFDWRWHWITATTSGLEENIYRQELTAGLGLRF